MIVRNARQADNPRIMEVKPFLVESQFAQRLLEQQRGIAEFLVVEEDSGIIGFVFLKYYGKTTHPEYPDLEDLFTKETERRKGYATTLLLACEDKVKAKQFTKIGLATSPDQNNPGRKLYEKLGYKPDGKETYVDGVYDGIPDWVIDMEKDLD